MKTKVKIVTRDFSRVLPNTDYVITPHRLNRYSSGNMEVRGTTDHEGYDVVSLDPAWYPYNLSFRTSSDRFNKTFFVFESDTTLQFEDVEVSYLSADMLTPNGAALAKILRAQAEAQVALKKIQEEKDSALSNITNAQTTVFTGKMAQLVSSLNLLKSLVDALVADKTLILEEQKKLQAKTEELMNAHADMIQIAKDYVIAKNMGIINLGGHYLWFDSDNKLRWNTRLPNSETDGTAIN